MEGRNDSRDNMGRSRKEKERQKHERMAEITGIYISEEGRKG